MSTLSSAFGDELVKLGVAKWRTLLRTAPEEKFRDVMAKLFRRVGASKPHVPEITPAVRESVIKDLSGYNKLDHVVAAPRGSALWRQGMKDIKEGRMIEIETGTSMRNAKLIKKHGPSGLAHRPMSENMPAISDSYSDTMWKARRNKKLSRSDKRRMDNRLGAGLFANDKGTKRTADYAARASVDGTAPVAMRFSLPASFVTPGQGLEYRVPNELFRNWARKIKIERP